LSEVKGRGNERFGNFARQRVTSDNSVSLIRNEQTSDKLGLNFKLRHSSELKRYIRVTMSWERRLSPLLLLMPNTDRLQQVENYVIG